MFSTSTDGEVMWWDIRKLVEPVETLQLEFAGYMPGQRLGGIVMEYESTMVHLSLLSTSSQALVEHAIIDESCLFSLPSSWLEQNRV